MSHLLDDEDDLPRRGERELTLSTGAILGIFFGLALLCALFFGFGYNMGHKATPQTTLAADSPYEGGASSGYAFNSAKPSAGSTSVQPVTPAASTTPVDLTGVVGAPAHSAATAAASTASATLAAPVVRSAESNSSRPEASAAPAEIPHQAPLPIARGNYTSGNFVVQVAAVSHQEDADLLVNALRRKGYSVAARNESADKLVHIQVGPFNDHKDADTMRLRLVTDGYNAIIKQL